MVILVAGIRLVSDDDPKSGRVLLLHNGQWGTVCNDLFDSSPNGPNVVC